MNDLYLFRAKRLDNNEWIIGHILEGAHGQFSILEMNANWPNNLYCNVAAETIGRCTGQKDVNGVLIFEGDIIRNIGTGKYYIIAWRNTGFEYLDASGEHWRWDTKSMIEVIGSIHDNPELMEDVK